MCGLRWTTRLGVTSSCYTAVAEAGDSSMFSWNSCGQKGTLSDSEHTSFSSKPRSPIKQRTTQWNPLSSQLLNGYIAWIFKKVFKGLHREQVHICPEAELGRLRYAWFLSYFLKRIVKQFLLFLLLLTPLICYFSPGSRKKEHFPVLLLPYMLWGNGTSGVIYAVCTYKAGIRRPSVRSTHPCLPLLYLWFPSPSQLNSPFTAEM